MPLSARRPMRLTLVCPRPVASSGAGAGGGLAAGGYVWRLNQTTSAGGELTTEDGDFLTTEDGYNLTTEYNTDLWRDNATTPSIALASVRLGHSPTTTLRMDRATVLVGSTAPVTVSMKTAAVTTTVEATPTPNASADGIYRALAGADIQGRGGTVTVSPTTATAQWSCHGMVGDAGASIAGPDEA